MIQQKSRIARPRTTPIKFIESVLAIFVFGQGAWMAHLGWNNPRHVGWIPSGAILMTGMIACTYLVWRRRGTERSTLGPIMFTLQLAQFVEGILKWRAKEEGAVWPTLSCVLAVLFLALIVWEEITHRKDAAKDSIRESKWFDEEDRR